MASVPRVLIIDHDPEARYRARQLVEQAGFAPAGEAGLGTEGIALAVDARPDVILFALKEPIARAIQTIEALIHDLPETPLIAYAESADIQIVRQAMLAGARDFLEMPMGREEMRRSLVAALESEERRRLRATNGAATLGPRGAIITVFGAKGGAGKTTVATNLAVALALRGDQSVALVDADESFGDAGASLGMPEGTGIVDALREPDAFKLDASPYVTRHQSGVDVLQGPSSPFAWRDISGDQVREALTELSRQYDVVVVDTASTLSDVSIAVLQVASLVLWVSTPDYASAHDSVRALQVLSSISLEDDRVKLVMNVNTPEVDVNVASVEAALGRRVFWAVPYDRQVRRGAQLGRTAVEIHDRDAACSFADLAAVLSGGPPVRRQAGLIGKLLGRGNGATARAGART